MQICKGSLIIKQVNNREKGKRKNIYLFDFFVKRCFDSDIAWVKLFERIDGARYAAGVGWAAAAVGWVAAAAAAARVHIIRVAGPVGRLTAGPAAGQAGYLQAVEPLTLNKKNTWVIFTIHAKLTY